MSMTPKRRIPELSTAWHEWIATNLQRGCTHESMIEVMVQNHLDLALCQRAIALHLQPPAVDDTRKTTAQTAEDAYHYESSRIRPGNRLQPGDRNVTVALRLTRPDVVVFDDVLSIAECEELIERARTKLQRSTIVDPQTGESSVIAARSSQGTYFQRNENDLIRRLDQRIAELMDWPVQNGEGIQILHYLPGAEYKAHFDYFPYDDTGSSKHLALGGQRVATLVMYLNDVEEGGETTFPSVGLSVTPRRGSATYFAYCNSAGQVDPATLHAGAPVVKGEKWIATKWMRQNRYGGG